MRGEDKPSPDENFAITRHAGDPSRSMEAATVAALSTGTPTRKRKTPSKGGKSAGSVTVDAVASDMDSAQGDDDDSLKPKLPYQRIQVACGHCRRRKIRCQPNEVEGLPCHMCEKLEKECVYGPVIRTEVDLQAKRRKPKAFDEPPAPSSVGSTPPATALPDHQGTALQSFHSGRRDQHDVTRAPAAMFSHLQSDVTPPHFHHDEHTATASVPSSGAVWQAHSGLVPSSLALVAGQTMQQTMPQTMPIFGSHHNTGVPTMYPQAHVPSSQLVYPETGSHVEQMWQGQQAHMTYAQHAQEGALPLHLTASASQSRFGQLNSSAQMSSGRPFPNSTGGFALPQQQVSHIDPVFETFDSSWYQQTWDPHGLSASHGHTGLHGQDEDSSHAHEPG